MLSSYHDDNTVVISALNGSQVAITWEHVFHAEEARRGPATVRLEQLRKDGISYSEQSFFCTLSFAGHDSLAMRRILTACAPKLRTMAQQTASRLHGARFESSLGVLILFRCLDFRIRIVCGSMPTTPIGPQGPLQQIGAQGHTGAMGPMRAGPAGRSG